MAQISFETAQNMSDTEKQNIGFFSLKNDGDEAIVRFLYDSTDEFEILSVHTIRVGNSDRKISCLRTPNEPTSNCPLCANGKTYAGRFGPINEATTQNKFFVKMLQYVRNADGTVGVLPVIWERPIAFAKELSNLIKEYGPLSECVFKIVRSGTGTSTKYTPMFGNPSVYRNDIYVKDVSAFEGYTALGRIVLNKNVNEINQYMVTGEFPQTNNNANTVPSTPAVPTPPASNFAPAFDEVPFTGPTNDVPWTTESAMERPRRY